MNDILEKNGKENIAVDSFLVNLLRIRAQGSGDFRDLTDEDLKSATSTIFIAGQDTVSIVF